MTVTIEDIINIIDASDAMTDISSLINDMPLAEQDVDSLDMANIYLLIEEKYNIKIPDTDLDKLQSINDICIYLNA